MLIHSYILAKAVVFEIRSVKEMTVCPQKFHPITNFIFIWKHATIRTQNRNPWVTYFSNSTKPCSLLFYPSNWTSLNNVK